MRLWTYMNDKWLLFIGIPLVGFAMPLIFNQLNLSLLFNEGYRNLVMSVITTITIWLGIRSIVIYLWKKYPWEKDPWMHLICELVMVTAYTSLIGFLSYLLYMHTNFVNLEDDYDLFPSVAITILITYLITCIHEAWFFYTQWNISLVKAQVLEKENIQSQYETLKSQVNPHFLFNTLNTLATLIEENPQVAVKYVENTADFLRNILSMKDKEVISLKEEINIINTFYALQKQRFGDNLQMELLVSPASLEMQIPPLSLQMLVENAIKHNIISSDMPLHIIIEANKHGIVSVKNNLQKKMQHKPSSGIGLQNIRNRFSFLSDQAIEVNETEAHFEVILSLLTE